MGAEASASFQATDGATLRGHVFLPPESVPMPAGSYPGVVITDGSVQAYEELYYTIAGIKVPDAVSFYYQWAWALHDPATGAAPPASASGRAARRGSRRRRDAVSAGAA